MRLGMPIWNGRISPVLDTAERLLIVDSAGSGWTARREVLLRPDSVALQASRLSQLDLDLLVCGAVSRVLREMLVAGGLTVVPWIAGEVDDVLAAVETEQLGASRFSMPGCCRRRGGPGRHGRAQGGHWNRRRRTG